MSQAYCLLRSGCGIWLWMQPTFMPSSFVDRPHPVGVALGEVVVHRGQVGALAFERGQVQRQRGGERFAFAGLHLDDRVVMHGRAAQELHVEVPHVELPPARLAHQGERLDQQVDRAARRCGPDSAARDSSS